MKKAALVLSLVGALFSGSAISSSPVANLKINGNIKPPTCTVNGVVQNDVIFNFGKTSLGLIPQSTTYRYSGSELQETVTVECDAETYLTFVALDIYGNTPLSVNNTNEWFHLVDVSKPDKSVGATLFNMINVFVDGKKAYISQANDAGLTGDMIWSTILYSGPTHAFTSEQQTRVDKNMLKLVGGKLFQVSFKIMTNSPILQSFILSKNELNQKGIDTSDGFDFMGEAVLTFKFGV